MSAKFHIWLLILLITDIFQIQGLAQDIEKDILILSPQDEEYQSGRYFFHQYLYAFIDSTDTRTIEEVASDSFQQRFTKESLWRTINFGGDMGPDIHYIWARLTILSQLEKDEEWLVNFFAGEVDLYVPIDSNRFDHQRTGRSLSLRDRAFRGNYGLLPCLPLQLPAKDTLIVYFKLKGIGGIGLGPRGIFIQNLFKPECYIELDRRIRFMDALVIGIMIGVAIYHLIIFFYQRNFASLFFSIFALAFSGIIMGYRGYSQEFVYPAWHFQNEIILAPITWSVVYLFHYLFSRLYLKLPKLLPVWDKIWAGITFIDIVSTALLVRMVLNADGLANVIPDEFWNLVRIRVIINALLFILIIVVPVLSFIKGNKGALIYLIAMFAYVFQEFLNNINGFFGFLHIPFHIYDYTGQTAMVLLFAMGIARQLKTLQEEKFAAEQAELTERAEADRIRELDAFKSRFYTNITHQFRTPITIILGMADQVRVHSGAWLTKEIDMISRNGRRLLRLVNQILDLSKLEVGQLPVRMIQSDVVRFIRYVVESFHSSAWQKNIQLRFHSDLKELVMDYDPDKLTDILSNLISNAIKFTQEGGKVQLAVSGEHLTVGNLELQTTDNLLPSENCLMLTVTDNGPGISPSDLPHIFNRFYQAGHSQSKGEGAGIGLALTRELVRLLGGEITVENEPGKGTKFSVFLPITRSAKPGHENSKPDFMEAVSTYLPPYEAAGTGEPEAPKAGRSTVLIVEDNSDVVEYLRALLSSRFHLEVANDGKPGLDKARRIIPDMIISDIMMPEMDGVEMCKQLKEDLRTSHIPVILLTAKSDEASRMEGLRTGADAYLTKPFNKTELLIRIDKLIELRTRLQERYRDIRFLFHPEHVLPEKDIHAEDHFIRELHRHIDENLSDPDFSIVRLCKRLGMSRAQLYKKFKALTNQSISEFIRKIRLHKAHQLLQTTDMNVTQVSIDVGFRNLATFTRNFTAEIGINPREVKKPQNRNQLR